mmetsp:Transcript_30864/g.71311  ORF Transcript_30864/g.71311 Transcript_30864/m.71311 type:complete len:576 (+) Transcript_30864:30-1757(+)
MACCCDQRRDVAVVFEDVRVQQVPTYDTDIPLPVLDEMQNGVEDRSPLQKASQEEAVALPVALSEVKPVTSFTGHSSSLSSPATSVTKVMSKWSRLERSAHLQVDGEILRGMSLRKSLKNGGAIWRNRPSDLTYEERQKLWNTAQQVASFDIFVSHTWLTAGIWKFFSMLLAFRWVELMGVWAVAVGITFSLCLFDVLPLPLHYDVSILDWSGSCPFGPWILTASCLSTILGLFVAPYLPACRDHHIFLDTVSIHQSDSDLKERGIYGIGGCISVSKELRVLWSPPYFSRLWCIFELAAFHRANPFGRITLAPVFMEANVLVWMVGAYAPAFCFWTAIAIEVYEGSSGSSWSALLYLVALAPLIIVLHVLRRSILAKHKLLADLENFDLQNVECQDDFDRQFVHSALRAWYGSSEAFTEYVRTTLREVLLSNFYTTRVQFQYILLMVRAQVSVSLEVVLGFVKSDAPVECVISYVVGYTIAFHVLSFSLAFCLALYLCDRFASPYKGSWLMNQVQTVAIFLACCSLWYASAQICQSISRWRLEASICWAVVLAFCCWLCYGPVCGSGWAERKTPG